jgi:hypothetical protein
VTVDWCICHLLWSVKRAAIPGSRRIELFRWLHRWRFNDAARRPRFETSFRHDPRALGHEGRAYFRSLGLELAFQLPHAGGASIVCRLEGRDLVTVVDALRCKDVKAALEKMAKADDRSLSYVINKIVADYLKARKLIK